MQMLMPDLKELFFKIKPIIDDNVGKVYAQEQALYSDKYRIAGRVDLIAEWNGKLAVIDFKTSTKQKNEEDIQNYFMQCTAYALMFAERTGIWIDDIVVLIATEEGDALLFERQIHDYRKPLMEYIDKYA
jgi:genome maintenance exonuclease 1